MRSSLALLFVAACSVPDKNPATDGGIDGPLPDGAVDEGAPDTMILESPAMFSNTGAATFVFESNDPSATFTCSIDEETPVPCSSPYTRTLNDGPHGIVIRAVDAAGNSDDSPAEHRWTIDTVAPDTVLTERPPVADNSVVVRFDFESAEPNVTYECSVDNAAFVACEPDQEFGPLGEGPHSFAVRALDRAGNVDSTPAIHAWSIDTTMPDTQILSGPNDIVGTTSATFTFNSPDAGGGATFTCSLDGGAFTPCASPATFTGLAERMHTFQVRVRDAVGNLDPTPAVREWLVDLSAPNTTITDGPTGTMPSASATFVFTASEQNARFECALDAAAFADCTSPHTMMMLSQGEHTFAVRAIDGANHPDPSPATRTWTVDTVAPTVAITSGPAPGSTSGPFVSYTFAASEGATQCSLDGAAFTACTSPFTFNAPAGGHTFSVRAADAAGNAGMENRNWTIACAPPSETGAAGLLHLDDTGQTLANAAGGAAATLGNDATVEPADPAQGSGRFAGGIAFAAGQHVAWPVALGATSVFSLELWSNPTGGGVLFVSADGKIAVRAVAAGGAVRYSVSVITGPGNQMATATSREVAAGAWHHVLASLDGSNLRLWVDGVRTQVEGPGGPEAPVLDAVQLGGDHAGSIDEVWLAQTAITADDAARTRYCPL
jgi:hypothetical protein